MLTCCTNEHYLHNEISVRIQVINLQLILETIGLLKILLQHFHLTLLILHFWNESVLESFAISEIYTSPIFNHLAAELGSLIR